MLSELARLGARLIIQRAVEDEFDQWLGRARYERRPEAGPAKRNGFRPRRVQTGEGVSQIRPRSRRGQARPWLHNPDSPSNCRRRQSLRRAKDDLCRPSNRVADRVQDRALRNCRCSAGMQCVRRPSGRWIGLSPWRGLQLQQPFHVLCPHLGAGSGRLRLTDRHRLRYDVGRATDRRRDARCGHTPPPGRPPAGSARSRGWTRPARGESRPAGHHGPKSSVNLVVRAADEPYHVGLGTYACSFDSAAVREAKRAHDRDRRRRDYRPCRCLVSDL
jgi:hypothetical protein